MPASITLTVAHLPTSTSFFLSALHPLNYIYRGRVADTIGFGHPDAAPDFWITQSIPGVPPGPAHVAFPALSRGKVHEFFHAALKAGGKIHGEPALRDDCGYYSAAIIDFDGNSIEAVYRPDLLEANKGNIADSGSVVSMTKPVTRSTAPTAVSSASKAKTVTLSRAGSAAPSATGSRVPSRAPSVSASHVARSVASEAPVRTTISRAPTAPAAVQGSGNNFADMLNEAKGTVAFAREMVNTVRPLTSAPAPSAERISGSPDSHGPSDTIVGTLLGVAAGAALHYAFSNRNKPTESASAPVTPPEGYKAIARSESSPSWTEERYYYYHTQPQQQHALPGPTTVTRYAVESPPSEASASNRGGPRLIEMIDNDRSLSDIGASRTSRRRSSFSAVSGGMQRTAASRAKSGTKLLESPPPPTSYRGPTVVTTTSNHSRRTSGRSNNNKNNDRSHSRTQDEGYASASDDRRSRTKSSHSHRSRRASSSSGASGSTTTITAVRTTPSQTPLPASRAASHIDDRDSFHSTRSRPAKTVIGRLTERQLSKLEDGGRLDKGHTDVTRSVIGKIKEVDRVDVTRREIGPEDSVSQVSSSRGSRRRH